MPYLANLFLNRIHTLLCILYMYLHIYRQSYCPFIVGIRTLYVLSCTDFVLFDVLTSGNYIITVHHLLFWYAWLEVSWPCMFFTWHGCIFFSCGVCNARLCCRTRIVIWTNSWMSNLLHSISMCYVCWDPLHFFPFRRDGYKGF